MLPTCSTRLPIAVILVGILSLPPSLAAQWLDGGIAVSSGTTGRFMGPILPDGSGGAYLAWAEYREDSDPSNPDAYVQHLRMDGTIDPSWPASALRICDVDGRKSPAGLESDGNGGFIVVWSDYRNPPPDSSYAYELYAKRISSAGVIAPGWPAGGLRVSGVKTSWPVLTCSDGAGGIYIGWQTPYVSPYGDEGGVWIQRITVNGEVAPGWPLDGIVGADPPYGQYPRALIADGSGGVFLLWDADSGGHSHAIRFTSEGAVSPGWPNDGIDFSQEYSFGGTGAVLPEGGLIAFWAPTGGVYPPDVLKATRISPEGLVAPGWPSTGVTISTRGANEPLACTATSDGGATVAWARFEPGEVALYAQKVAADGTIPPGWDPDGVFILSSPAYSQEIAIVSDESGGAYICWEGGQSAPYGSTGVSAQHLLASGVPAPGWPTSGLPLSSPQSSGHSPAIAVASPGGAIVAWSGYDFGLAKSSIRAQRLSPSGPESFSIGLVESDGRSDRVRLRWRPRPRAESPLMVQRRMEAEGWQDLTVLQPDASGDYFLEDRAVTPGVTYDYRLSVSVEGTVRTFGDASVTVPRLQLAIRAATVQRSASGPSVAIEIPTGAAARVSLIDLHGRTVSAVDAGSNGPGVHPIQLPGAARLAAGVYFMVLEQAGHRVTKRLVLLH